ncbi:hypothetical protein PR003_g26405 [Phytophthora rubi]|uniref:Uncharacterized protein n=1 Tax=Phytophthora rubi TaxID=129364 RepID=A0A6A4C6L9_9STRA|nr:hypothetical protein PR002_g25722 [Phytophthora rubi]KAE8977477.1 hypothetical protein PR001_g25115 [Phytophthora rubi]KAE9286110.1 hypothetical protein PR003_g26405 [Phytophthora rubi]
MSATPPLPPLEVASAAFFRLECSDAQLFQTEYKRSNRTKGLKILRCFPHCCPEHIDRSYCGTSLSVRVELAARASDAAPPPPSQVVAVFARFEATSDVSLRPGECVEVAKMAAGTQSDSNQEGQWVAGSLDRPSRLVTTIRTPGTPSDDHKPLVFHLNGKPFSRWYYDWESGANKAHRLTKHVLKAYIVERCAVDQHDNFTDFTRPCAHTQLYRVLHVVSSPEFTVISYRRAPSERFQGVPDGGSPASVGSSYHGLDPVRSFNTVYSHHSRVLEPQLQAMKVDPSEAYHESRPQSSRVSSPPSYATEVSGRLEDQLRWEHANQSAVSVSKNLALACALDRLAPLSVYASCVDNVASCVQQRLQEAFGGTSSEVDMLNCFSKVLFAQAAADSASPAASSVLKDDVEPSKTLPSHLNSLMSALAKATLWFFSTSTQRWMRTFFRQYAEAILDMHALRACFVLFVKEMRNRLDMEVFQQTDLQGLTNVAEEVIAAVYSCSLFHARRAQVREILSGQSFAGWSAFVAQMRQTYINLSSCPRTIAVRGSEPSFDRAHPPRNLVESDWNAEWLLQVDEAMWKPSQQTVKVDFDSGVDDLEEDDEAVGLHTLFDVISQIARLQVAFDVEASVLHVRSTEGVTGALDSMRLVLDGKERVFSQFPNGMASGISSGTHGDYIGEMRVEKPGRLIVYLHIFNWSAEKTRLSYSARRNYSRT